MVIVKHFMDLKRRCSAWTEQQTAFMDAIKMLRDCVTTRGTIFVCGNGGSAADAEHIVGELMKGFVLDRHMPQTHRDAIRASYPLQVEALECLQCGIPAISLVAGVSVPTAVANDMRADLCFAQQVYVLAKPKDVLWGISTSGNSENVNHALRIARIKGCHTLGLSGKDGGAMAELLDVELRAPSCSTPEIQEMHLPLYHSMCACLEEVLFSA